MTSRSLATIGLLASAVLVAPISAYGWAETTRPKTHTNTTVMSQHSDWMPARHRRPTFRTIFPIAPSYVAHDYPYYYSRGHYPTHIGPGYIYPIPVMRFRARSSARSVMVCSNQRLRCAAW